MWKALVRPVLEYAAELWAGDIPQKLVKEAEKVQTDFARMVLGLKGKWGVSSDFVRAELGLEKLESRWEKLRLGYWRKIQSAKPERILSIIARLREQQVRTSTGRAGKLSWVRGTRELLMKRNLTQYWLAPSECYEEMSREQWKVIVYREVEDWFESEREERMSKMSSAEMYVDVKEWQEMDRQRAEFRGEVGKKGALVSERYLDDVEERLGTHLKLLCRAGCLPVLRKVAVEARASQNIAVCLQCDSGEREDMEHFVFDCKAYKRHRERLMTKVTEWFRIGTGREWGGETRQEQMKVLMGKRIGGRVLEDNVDHAMKRYLKKAWRERRGVTRAVNEEFGREDILGDKWR